VASHPGRRITPPSTSIDATVVSLVDDDDDGDLDDDVRRSIASSAFRCVSTIRAREGEREARMRDEDAREREDDDGWRARASAPASARIVREAKDDFARRSTSSGE